MTGMDESVVRDQAGQPGMHLVQVGWQVHDRDADLVGSVISRDESAMVVELDGSDGDRVRIPVTLIAEEDEGAMLATLSVDSSELDSVVPLDGDDEGPIGLT